MKRSHQSDVEFFTVYDSKTKSYCEPFPSQNSEACIRDFLNAFKKPEAANNNRYLQNAEDFALFRVASFDLKDGSLVAINPEHVVNMHDLRAMVQPKPALSPT